MLDSIYIYSFHRFPTIDSCFHSSIYPPVHRSVRLSFSLPCVLSFFRSSLSFVLPFTHLLSFVHVFFRSFVRPCFRYSARSFARSFAPSLVHLFLRSFPCLFVRSSFLSSFVRSPFRSFVRLFICSLHLYFLQEKDQGSRLAVMKINTKRKDALPIIDIAPTHIGKTGEPFRLEIGPVCFMF